jgi:hypothetical protein
VPEGAVIVPCKAAVALRRRLAMGAVSTCLLLACGPVAVDLGGGVAAQGGSAGTGGSRATGGVGGAEVGRDQFCGDGIVQGPERCDDARMGIDCPLDCGLDESTGGTNGTGGRGYGGMGGSDQFCGDGVVQYPEECDDPRGLNAECTPDCALRHSGTAGIGMGGTGGSPDQFCGDGIIQYPEECDDPRGLEGSCTPDCRIRVNSGGEGGTGVGGAYAAGGRAGAYAAGGSESYQACSTELVLGSTECAANDELLGQAYERCTDLERSLTTVRFNAPCDGYASSSIEVECCDRAGGAGASGIGGAG